MRKQKVTANWISYIESRQSGNCESGSRAWSQSLAYVIARNHAHNVADKHAWLDVAKRLAHATESNPIASISLALCDRIMSNLDAYDTDDYENVSCTHECDDDCSEECWHECDDDCFAGNNMARALDTLRGYEEVEWTRAYEYASRGSFIRALNIPESLHNVADGLSVSPYANSNNILTDMRAREAYVATARHRTLPRVDFGHALQDSYSLATLVFMAQFAPDQFDSFATLYAMSLTPTPNVSLLAFRRNPVSALSFVQDTAQGMAMFATENEESYRNAYATWLTSQVRTTLHDHALNTLYSYDVSLHANVTTYELTECFNTVRYNAHNVYNALTRLTCYALQDKTTAHFVTSVSYFACVARVLASRLTRYQVTYLTESNATDIISQVYYWREVHTEAWRMYVAMMRARYVEIATPHVTEVDSNV